MEGFIKLNRKMLTWEWYDDINTFKLFIHILFKVSWKKKKWHGIDIEPGQLITSLPKLSEETHLTIRQTRTALEHLKTTGEVTDKPYSKFRIITVNNWGRYQANDTQDDRQTTDKRHANRRQTTASKERKEIKKERNNNSVSQFKKRDYDFAKLEKEV